MSAHDDLQEQLLESVARRARGTARIRWRLPKWRGLRSRGGLLLIGIPLLFVAAAAATTIATRSSESPAERLLEHVLSLTHIGSTSGPCAVYGHGRHAPLSDEAPDPRITAVLPGLATAPAQAPASSLVTMVEDSSGGAILARTIREVHLPGGTTLVVWVDHGGLGGFETVDPRRCLAARLAKLAELRPDPHNQLRETVAREIRKEIDTNDKEQSLAIFELRGASLDGGASFPVRPALKRLPTGVLYSSSGCNRHVCSPTLYDGIVGPKVADLTIVPVRHAGGHGRRVRRRVAVVEGFFAFALPRNSGPETITQRTRNGTALTTKPLSPRLRRIRSHGSPAHPDKASAEEGH